MGNSDDSVIDRHSVRAERKTAAGWRHILGDASIELIPQQALEFAPVSNSFAPDALTFLPHIAGKPLADQVAAAQHLIARGLRPVAHLSARNFASYSELDRHLDDLSLAGVTHCLAIGGVPAVTPNAAIPTALQMIDRASFRDAGFKTVFIAGHPEGITDVPGEVLFSALDEKISILRAQGRSVEIATQFGFDGAGMARWAADLKARGVDVPVRFGVAGVTSLPKLIKFAIMCGVGASLNVLRQRSLSVLKVMKDQDPQEVLEALNSTLQQVDAPPVRIHFFPFGGWEKTAVWLASKRSQ